MPILNSVFSRVFRSVIGDVDWVPNSLFALGEPGVWYDPSDLTTLFQDNLGATPVTAPAQTVGKMLDKSGRGNHATQATLGQRPTYGINPITGTRNLLTYTEQFDNAYWTKGAASISANAIAAPDGTTTADKLVENTSPTEHVIRRSSIGIGQKTASIYFKAGERTQAALYLYNATNGASASVFDLSAGTVISGTGTISSVGNGWYRCTQTRTSTVTDEVVFCPAVAGSTTYLGNGTSGIYVWGAQLEVSATATAYQKVVTQYEVTEAGVASASYISFDGTDDGMATGTITPAIDKVQVFAGVRKLSDAAQKIVAEMSATIASNAGAFALTAPNSAAANYNFSSKGTTQTDNVVTTYTAPITSVISGLGDIAGASNVIRVNGSQVGSVLTTQGTGNYLAYPLYLGRRGGSTLPYNGRIYSLIARFGANLTDGQITSTESWVNAKVGAY